MDASSTELLARLPDLPRYVEARSAVLGGRAEVSGVCDAGLLVRDTVSGLVCVVGAPAAEAVGQAASQARTIIADLGFSMPVGGWRSERATLYQLAGEALVRAAGTRLIAPEELAEFALPAELREELVAVSAYAPIAARFVEDAPVSFCYALETESQWDVSIDTLAGHRGRGYAAECVAWMIEYEARRGRRPVWGAVESNAASHALARKLGFAAVDTIGVWEPVSAGAC